MPMMISHPKITIIIPSYNQGIFIEQTILSIINQNYPNLELIIIDGGSSDITVEVITKYRDNLSYWVSEPDHGQAHAINKGLCVATGEVVNWINSDDYLEPGSLHKIGEFFATHTDKLALCGFTHCFYNEDLSSSHTYRMGIKSNTTDTIINYAMNQPGTFYRMSVFKALCGVNETLRYVFDNDLWFRFLSKFGVESVGVTNSILANFRLHKDSKSVGEGFEKFWYEQNSIWLHMAHQLNFSPNLISCIAELPHVFYYKSDEWDFLHIKREAIECFWYNKYLNSLFLKGYLQEAKTAIRLLLRENRFDYNRVNLSLMIKLFLLPNFKKLWQ
jgi:glycosyltransferase involved in cell wall biosynthesis